MDEKLPVPGNRRSAIIRKRKHLHDYPEREKRVREFEESHVKGRSRKAGESDDNEGTQLDCDQTQYHVKLQYKARNDKKTKTPNYTPKSGPLWY